MSNLLLHTSSIVKAQLRTDLPEFRVGAVVSVHYKIKEGNKERIQIFTGIVINRHAGNSIDASFTVLKVGAGAVKVTRVFALHTPNIAKLEVIQNQRARKANLRYLKNIKDPIKSVRIKKMAKSA
jgi:large subunit ribosomal protein L19